VLLTLLVGFGRCLFLILGSPSYSALYLSNLARIDHVLHIHLECSKFEQVNHTATEGDPVGGIGGNCGGDGSYHCRNRNA
jgi:hypothetical protein